MAQKELRAAATHMKNICFALSLSLACCFAGLLAGCQLQRPWHLQANKKGETVQLCLSNELACPQPEGVRPSGISVYRFDSTYDNEIVWDTEPDNPIMDAKISGVITYGIPPQHWSNKIAPPALTCGKAYLVNPGAQLFGLQCDGSVVALDLEHLEAFFRQEIPQK